MTAVRLIVYLVLVLITVVVLQSMFGFWKTLYLTQTDPSLAIVIFHTFVLGAIGLAFREVHQSRL